MEHPFPPDWAAARAKTLVREPEICAACERFCPAGRQSKAAPPPTRLGSALAYFGEEYEQLLLLCKIKPRNTTPPPQFALDCGGPRPLRALLHQPGAEPTRKNERYAPVLTQLYPFAPVQDNYGALLDLAPLSLLDLTALLRAGHAHCPIWNERRKHYLTHWRSRTPELRALRHPLLLLYLDAYAAFQASYTERFHPWSERYGDGKTLDSAFWSAWEQDFLSRPCYEEGLLRERVRTKRAELEKIYGTFL